MKQLLMILTAVCLLFSVIPLYAQDELPGYDFLRTDVSARAAGLGGAFTGVADDANSIFYNPAGIASATKRTGSFTYVDHIMDFKNGTVTYTHPLRPGLNLSMGIYYLDYGEFAGRDINGNDTGTFGANDYYVQAGAGYKYRDNIFLGFTGKFFSSKIESYSSTGIGFDAGALYMIKPGVTTAGIAIQNIGSVTSAFIESKDALPTVVKGGLTHKLAHLPLMLSLESRYYTYGKFYFAGGGEFSFSSRLKGRFGYNSNRDDMKLGADDDRLAGFSFGLGFNWKKFNIDYAFSSLGGIGSQNRITFAGSF